MAFYERELPLYRVHYYNEFVYKIVKYKRRYSGFGRLPEEREEAPEGKFSQALSRARSKLLQYALCNEWDFFATITVSPERFERTDLQSIHKYLSQWFLDYRKRYGSEVKYVLVPEVHKKGGWHFHGFIRGIKAEHLSRFVAGVHPVKLVNGDYYNFGRLSEAVGYVSLSPVKNSVGASFYMMKYITKEMVVSGYYEHLYFACRGLNTARPAADVYAYNQRLEGLLQAENDFSCTGWAIGEGIDWKFPFTLEFAEFPVDYELTPFTDEQIMNAVSSVEEDYEQMKIAGWCSGNIPVL